ncbi:PREDICTED: proton-coupled folate transporter-like [Amphimedon queenslandica]|uniref:Major facilitator superfamily (MFS) profile domain-containing protein n=1 Tax=Amphimedon queenslandica TaxID=400682 RepID=A0AAN0J557_AMPQE|nr:PREDICTED: proton-coupled folate transporter-like [Amphimedon queenslandica]|eukprot:XP_019851843.1 PREDICTED: proton-coupled folate transporter-like [Amphimedon queenslandica]
MKMTSMKEENESLLKNDDSSADEKDEETSIRPLRKWLLWKNIKFFVIPVELSAFFYLFTIYFQMQFYQQYFYQRIMKQEILDFNNISNEQDDWYFENDSTCLNQDAITNMSSQATFLKGQKEVNHLNMISTLISLSLSVVTSLFLIPYSDVYGRKPFIAIVFVGQAAATVVSIFIVYFKLNMYYFCLTSAINGISGGFGVILSSAAAYVTDITPPRWLTIRMAIVSSMIFVGGAAGSPAADKWIDANGCDFHPMVWLILASFLCGLLYTVILLPESLSKDIKSKNHQTSRNGFRSLVQGIKIFTSLSYVDASTLIKLWIINAIIVLVMTDETGGVQIISYFLHNKPLEWGYTLIGNYLAVSSVAHILVLFIILPLMVLAKISDPIIMSVGIVFVLVGDLCIATFVSKTWEMFLVGIIISMEALISPSIKSYITRLVKKEDLGATFSVVAALQLIGTIIATVVFNEIYTPETTESVNSLSHSPRLVYWVSAALWGAGLILSLVLVFFRKKKIVSREKEVTKEPIQ